MLQEPSKDEPASDHEAYVDSTENNGGVHGADNDIMQVEITMAEVESTIEPVRKTSVTRAETIHQPYPRAAMGLKRQHNIRRVSE